MLPPAPASPAIMSNVKIPHSQAIYNTKCIYIKEEVQMVESCMS